MQFPLLLLYLLLTFPTSVLLVGCFLLPAKRTVAWIAVLIFWLCLIICPVQLLAALDLARVRSFPLTSPVFLLSWSGLAFLSALTLWLLRSRRRPPTVLRGSISEPRSPLPWHVILGLLIVLGTYGMLALRAAFSFPDLWDPIAYHYPVALRWLQEGTMRITPATNWHAGLPGNVEILDLLVLSAGRERLLGFVQWPGLVILLLACLQLGRRLRESAAPDWAVVTTALMIPIVAIQSTSGYVDLFGTAVLFASLTLVLEYCDQLGNKPPGELPTSLLFTAGLALGLAVGAKPVFWLFATLLVLLTFFLLSSRGGRRGTWGRLALFLLAIAVPSIFWFARAAGTGNPLYPFSVHLGPLSLPGVRPSEITQSDYYLTHVRHSAEFFVYPWLEFKRPVSFLLTNYGPGDGLGGAFATFVMPGVIFAAWLAKGRRPDLRVWLLSLGLLAILWWFTLEKVVRFGLPMCVLAAILSAPFFEVLERGATRSYRLVYVLVFAVTAWILIFEPLYTITQTVRYHTWSRTAYLGYPSVIDTLPPASTVLNLSGETLNFALAGTKLTNRVIPSWERPPLLTADFLRSRHVDYLVEKSAVETGGVFADEGPPLEGLVLYFKGSVLEAKKPVEWRIWTTDPVGR